MIFEAIAKPGTDKNFIDMVVEAEGMTITVKAGSFKWCGQEKELPEDESYTVEGHEAGADVLLYLVEDTEDDNAVHVLADEVALDGVELPLALVKGGRFHPLSRLLLARVPGGATSLDDVTAQIWKHVEDESWAKQSVRGMREERTLLSMQPPPKSESDSDEESP